MSFVESLLAVLANKIVASAAIGGLTVAGGVVAADRLEPAPPTDPLERIASGQQDEGEDADDLAGPVEQTTAADETDESSGFDAESVEDGDLDDGDLEDGDLEDGDEEGDRGRSAAVHAVKESGEVEPGSREFGRAVAAAASEGRSEQRGRSAEARAEREPQDPATTERPAAPTEPAAAGQERAEQNRQAAQEKRAAAQDRRPETDESDDADEADAEDADASVRPEAAAGRGRG
ncbi:hypothetical protein [Egicoccus sp. AB-alg6-2]|uniref:hypothetical protein n=1 Tax=Egicoccus sp. AB-alg6-2 TaxID=3242692 RepID=UPI00359DD6ED